MTAEHYPLQKAEGREAYFFESTGPRGTIKKIVEFQFMAGNVWNLGFGDVMPDGNWDDGAVSNNGDLIQIMATVAAAARLFCEKWPNRSLFISPFDERRYKLYHAIFERRLAEIDAVFTVKGIIGDHLFDFDPTKRYDAFLLAPKRVPLSNK